MAKLTADEFMKSIKELLGDRDDDVALKLLEDAKDTITEDKNDYKAKYEAVVKEKEDLDKEWRKKYKERFYSSDTNNPKDNDKDENEHNNPLDTRSDAEKQAESITIKDLFKSENE